MKKHLCRVFSLFVCLVVLVAQTLPVCAEESFGWRYSTFWDTFAIEYSSQEGLEVNWFDGFIRWKVWDGEDTDDDGIYTRGAGVARDLANQFDFVADAKFGGHGVGSDGLLRAHIPFKQFDASSSPVTVLYNQLGIPLLSGNANYNCTVSITSNPEFTAGAKLSASYIRDTTVFGASGLVYYAIYEGKNLRPGIYYWMNYDDIRGRYYDSKGKMTDCTNHMKGDLIGISKSVSGNTITNSQQQIKIGPVSPFPGSDSALIIETEYPYYLLCKVKLSDAVLANKLDELVGGGSDAHAGDGSETRVGSVAGTFGYIDADGKLVALDGLQLVNEGNKTVYNPVTGDTITFNDWMYDYSTRTYTINNVTGDTTIITYGDEYITINEGATVYNIYYITTNGSIDPNDPDPDPDPDPDADPDPDPDSDTDPDPDSDDGGLFGLLGELIGALIKGIGSFLTPILGAIVDFLISIVDKVMEGLGAFSALLLRMFEEIPGYFAGFTAFLVAVFPFMPAEFSSLIIFGILLLIIAAVVKRLLG